VFALRSLIDNPAAQQEIRVGHATVVDAQSTATSFVRASEDDGMAGQLQAFDTSGASKPFMAFELLFLIVCLKYWQSDF